MTAATGGLASSQPAGTGAFDYRPANQWGRLPESWKLGEVAAVGVDRFDRVYVFHRGEHPMLVFTTDGELVDSWGDGLFARPHGLHIVGDRAYTVDEGDHVVRVFSLEGELQLTIGLPGVPATPFSGAPFNRCTHTAITPDGDLLVADGYANARIHRFSPDGELILSWGEPGSGPGQFNLPHAIHCDRNGLVYVADRENHRVQVFDLNGAFVTQWNNLHRPSAMFITDGPDPVCYLGELGPYLNSNIGWPGLGPRISVLSMDGELLGRFESGVVEHGIGPGRFLSPHGMAVDSRGDLYLADVCISAWPSLFPHQPIPSELRGLHKFTKEPL